MESLIYEGGTSEGNGKWGYAKKTSNSNMPKQQENQEYTKRNNRERKKENTPHFLKRKGMKGNKEQGKGPKNLTTRA